MTSFVCVDCGHPVSRGSKRCKSCAQISLAAGSNEYDAVAGTKRCCTCHAVKRLEEFATGSGTGNTRGSCKVCEKKKYAIVCIDCGAQIARGSTRCKSCFTIYFGQHVRSAWNRGAYDNKPIHHHTEEYKAHSSKRMKDMWENGRFKGSHQTKAFRERRREIVTLEWREGKRKFLPPPHISKLENEFAAILDRISIHYERQYVIPGRKWIYDFYFPDRNVLVEIDGTYWHSLPRMVKRDAEKNGFGITNGFNIIHVSEALIKRLGFSACAELLCVELASTYGIKYLE